jgi:hypothetical protein
MSLLDLEIGRLFIVLLYCTVCIQTPYMMSETVYVNSSTYVRDGIFKPSIVLYLLDVHMAIGHTLLHKEY